MSDKFDALDARIRRLERQNAWLRFGCLTCVIALVSMLTMGQAKTAATVRAQRFVLLSANGETWGELSTEGDYPHLDIRSPNGEKQVHISPIGVSLSDHLLPGKLPLTYLGEQGLYLTEGHDKVVLELGGAQVDRLRLSPVPEIKLFDANGKAIWHAP